MLRVEPQRIDGSLERVANLLVSVELLGDLQGRMATNRQTASLAEEMQGIARDLRTQATELQKSVTGLRQAPASRLLRKVRRTVQALVYSQDCQIEWELAGEDVEIEQALIEEMEAPLTRLLCRLLQQGEQTSPASRAEEPDGSEPLGLGVARNTNQVSFTIQHIGLAIDPQQLADLAAEAGFGADVEIDCRCTPDTGTAVRLTAPVNDVTRAISGLLVVQNGQQFIIPFKHINEVVDVSALRISTVAGSQVATVRQTTYDAVSLGEALGLPSAEATASSARTGAVVVQCRKGTLCLLVDEIIGNRRTVVQGIEKILPGVRMIAGVAPTGQGRLALVVDVPGMVKSRASQ